MGVDKSHRVTTFSGYRLFATLTEDTYSPVEGEGVL